MIKKRLLVLSRNVENIRHKFSFLKKNRHDEKYTGWV